jgi:hypothetical protein
MVDLVGRGVIERWVRALFVVVTQVRGDAGATCNSVLREV